MMPEHCSEVSMLDVGFELTTEAIRTNLMGKRVYHKSNYLVLRKRKGATGDYSIVRVAGTGYGMFKEIEEVDIISLPDDTSFVKAPTADAFNHNSLSKAAECTGTRAVVIETEFDHITFIVKEEPIVMNVIDVVPPHPSKLTVLAERALGTMTLRRPVKIVPTIIDITKLVQAKEIVYPCRATDMGAHAHARFLHESPEIGDDTVVVGCEISKKIVMSEYKKRPNLVNICPKEFIKDIDGLKLIKCCLVEGRVEMEGDTAIVPWGVRLEDIREAVERLIALHEKE